jgi:N-acetylglucosamine kinase-like BadF-type ATPase
MNRYVIGLDSGASKSHLAVFDTDGSLIAFGSWGPLNHEVLPGSFAQLEKELGEFIAGVLRPRGLGSEAVAYAVFGLGGVDTKRQHGIISGIIKKIGVERFTLCNDAYLGIAAACPDNVGVCAINGSGCTIAGISPQGKMLQIGGIGDFSRDLGGAGTIGMSVLGAVYESLFRCGEPTALTQPVFEILGIKNKYDYIDAVSEITTREDFRLPDLNRLLFEHSGDAVSQRLLLEIAKNYAGGINCIIRELGFARGQAVTIVFAGSVFSKEKNPVLTNMIKGRLAALCPEYLLKYTVLKVPPVAGAIIWALGKLGAPESALSRVGAQLIKYN